ncbi:MAG: hypothetical protein K6A15_02215 [Treponema sp.]|nr:hypothetical protein [Treponema sp.]
MILTISNIKKSLKTIALAAALVLPLSCFNNVESVTPILPPVFPGEYGIYATLVGETPRTAIPTWPSTPEYYVEYSTLSDWDDVTKHIVITPASDPTAFMVDGSGAVKNFYLPLSNDSWVVEAGVKNGGVKQLTAKKTIPLTPDEPVVNESFFLQMPITENGQGSIELQVEVESGSGINFVEMLIQCGNNPTITPTRTGSNPYTFTASGIPNGKQKIIINAYESSNNTGNQLYSSVQDVIIYAGLTTNHWLINGSNPTGNKFTITSQMVADYLPRQFYVDSAVGLDSNSGLTKNFPFQTMTKAISAIQARNETNEFTIHIKDGSSFTNGGCTIIQQSIKIECWKNVPNDMLGSATWTLTGDGNGTSLQIGYTTTRGKITIVSANDSCGLTLFGNNQDHTCIQIYNGDFIMDGGKITGFGISSSNSIGAVNLPDNTNNPKRRVFTMRKGEISGNRAICSGVYIGSGSTCFIMEGGKIINNTSTTATGFAVGVYGAMYISGLVQIGGTDSTDNKFTDGSKSNLYLSEYKKLIINGNLATGSHIGLAVDFGSNIPSTTNQVAVTQNYTNNEAPSTFFNYDGSEAFVFVRSTQTGSVGEAALILGGGKIMSARDFNFSFTITDGDSNDANNQLLTINTNKQILISPLVTYGGSQLYYNSSTRVLYFDSAYTQPVSYEVVAFNVELSMYGVPFPAGSSYAPIAQSTAGAYTIPGLPYPGTYTLTVVITYMGIKYSANFDFVCTSS